MIKQKICQLVDGLDPEYKEIDYQVEYSPAGKGDYALNLAFKLAGPKKVSPLEIAGEIVIKLKKLPAAKKLFSEITVDHPGFINFTLKKDALQIFVEEILEQGKNYGQSLNQKPKNIQIEFISANPTGPLHLGNGRGGFTGDVLANILQATGNQVVREYYINDAGKQVNILTESVLRKYWDLQGLHVPYPDYCYQGKYIADLASKLKLYNYTLKDAEKIDLIKHKIKGQVLKMMIKDLKRQTKEVMGINFDEWFSEQSLHDSGLVAELLGVLKEKNLSYEKEGALWLKTTNYGDDKDRVLKKANGELTYFLSDIAYQYNKFIVRKFDKVIHIWGADHHGYVARLKAAVAIFTNKENVEFILMQLVKLIRDGRELKMSKRSGTFVTMEDLVDEVGLDAVRFFFLKYSADTHLDFDLDLALERSEKNPVFYVQYAHARICSILKEVDKVPLDKSVSDYQDEAEIELIKKLLQLPELILEISETYAVHLLPNYVLEVAAKFHSFYAHCRVIDQEKAAESRIKLIRATQVVLQNTLQIMGISAPEKMAEGERKLRYLI